MCENNKYDVNCLFGMKTSEMKTRFILSRDQYWTKQIKDLYNLKTLVITGYFFRLW